MNFVLKKELLSIPLLILIVFFINGCEKPTEKPVNEERIKIVKTFTIEQLENSREYSFPGIINPEKEIKLSFRVPGPIVQFKAETGKRVQKGDLIAQIDERDFKIRVKNLEATLDAAKAKLRDASLQYGRYKSLLKENAAAQSTFDRIEANYKAAKSQTEALEEQLANAENALFDTKLKAPIAGYINSLYTEKHETVQAGQPIVSIVDTSATEVEIFIPENLVNKAYSFKNYNFSPTAYPDRRFKAVLKEVGKKSTGPGQTYPLKLRSMPNDIIKPGMSSIVRFDLELHSNQSVFKIPLSAIVNTDYSSAHVWKLTPEKNTPVKTDVKIIKILKTGQAEISGDLKHGDKIVSAGANYIDENSKIKAMEPFSKTNIGNEL